ncbi:MAG: hypothetical protein RL648_121, partial [Verrucomicrobiota bacterium]
MTDSAPQTLSPDSHYPLNSVPGTDNKDVLRWVDRIARLCQPDRIHWV